MPSLHPFLLSSDGQDTRRSENLNLPRPLATSPAVACMGSVGGCPPWGCRVRIFNIDVAQLAQSVFPEGADADSKAAMSKELNALRPSMSQLYQWLEDLQILTAEVRTELMEHEMRAVLIQASIDPNRRKPLSPIYDVDLDSSVAQLKGMIEEGTRRFHGEHPEEA